MRFGMVGGSYTPYSISADSQRTVNLFPEAVESGKGKNDFVLYGAPGLTFLSKAMKVAIAGGGAAYTVDDVLTVVGGTGTAATLKVTSVAAGVIDGIRPLTGGNYSVNPSNPVSVTGGTGTGATFTLTFATVIKAKFYDTRTGRIFCVALFSDATVKLFELFLDGTENDLGELAASGGTSIPASISSNGLELLVINPETTETAHILNFSTNVLTDVTASIGDGEPLWAQFMDQYFIALSRDSAGTVRLYISGLLDGLTWDALDVATPESSPDLARMILKVGSKLLVFGDETIEPWFNSGAADFPFAPIIGTIIQQGLLHIYSPAQVGNTAIWVGRGKEGREMVWMLEGFTPVRISNHAVEASLQAKTVTGAKPVAWAYQQHGHHFYVLTYPDDNLTWVFDLATKMWYERPYLFSTTAQATGVLTTTGTFADGEEIVIDTVTYTMRTALSSPAVVNEVLIGASAAVSLDNLKSAINHTAGEGTTYSTGTVIHPTVSATTNTDTAQTVMADAVGGDGDSIITTTTALNASWGSATLTGGYEEQAHRARCHAFVGGEDGAAAANLVGDRANGKIYKLEMGALTDDGDSIRRERRGIHLANEQERNYYRSLQLEIEAGAGDFTLETSNDGGVTFGVPVTGRANFGNAGRFWGRLGSARDRVFRVRSTAAIKHCWNDAYLKLAQGGQ